MGIFDRFPYSSTHEMNLDYMLGKATEIAEDMQQVTAGMEQVQAGLTAISEKTEQATQAAAAAAQSASSIEGSVTAAEEAAEEAQMHNESAQTWANNAMTYKADCQRSATEAAASSVSAAQAATAAAASEDTVATYAQAANASAQSAANNNDSAHQYANQANASATNAMLHSSNAQTAATNAQTAATNATTSATNAETAATRAAATKTDVENLVESLPEDFTDLNNTVNQLSDEIDDLCKYVGKANVFDFIPLATFQNGYLNNNTPAELVASNNQLISNVFDVEIGTKLSIKVPTGYRIFVQYLTDSGAKDGGTGFYTADAELITTKRWVAFSITKNPYSVSDNITPSESSGFHVYRTITADANNLTKRIGDVETSVSGSLKFIRNLYTENIDTIKEPGYYYATLFGGDHVTGTLPPTLKAENGTNGFLTVESYYNFVTQTLVQFLTGRTFVRGANTSASLVFNPWIEISNDESQDTDEPIVHTRNLWRFGDQDITGYKQIGSAGTTLFPAGKYTLSCELTADESYINFNVYFSSGSQAQQIRPASNGRTIIQINATAPIERFFIQTQSGSGSQYTIQMQDIQLEKIYWSNYEYSSTDNWVPMPYTTQYIEHTVPLSEQESQYKSNWVGKKILFNGDSITQGISVGGEGKVGYVRTTCKLLRFGIVDNYAIGGTRLAHVEGEANCLVDRLNAMPTDADIVYIMANTNDYASQVPIGTNDSADTSTYKGALNALFTWLKTNYVQKPIIISTQLTRKINTSGDEPLPITPEEYVQAVRDMVDKYHFILFDAYKRSGMDLRTSPQDGTGITNDGLHPNQYGAELLGRKVAAFINVQ